ncbi:MAG: NYN domain-containing protein [Rhodocyclaceae bacterium]|nr:NYN domain-containing protein [Rhodocyclaceae bacterium]
MADAASARRLALLIDADNAQPGLVQPTLLAAASRGRLTVRRIYGDWTSSNMASWRSHLLNHSLRPIQQFRIVGGKNATDSALIIDAMDLLHSGAVEGFCIVSSDSDFTALARRLQEAGLFVMGIGRRTTPVAFQRACDEFVFTDEMDDERDEATKDAPAPGAAKTGKAPPAKSGTPAAAEKKAQPKPQKPGRALVKLLKECVRSATDEVTGWANVGKVGQMIRQADPGFTHKDYGFSSLSDLFASQKKLFDIDFDERRQRVVRLAAGAADPQSRQESLPI